MNKHIFALALAAALVVGGAGAAYGRQSSNSIVPTIKVNTTSGTLLTLKTSELSVLPQQSVTITLNGVSTVEQGPTLASLLTLAGVQYNAACRNDELRWWIEATASNGQAATLTAGEIDPLFGNRPAILSISENGQFLTSRGPTLIVPNDPAGKRNLKGVSVITVGRAPAQLFNSSTCSPTVAMSATPTPGTLVINGDVSSPQTLSFAQLQAVQPQLSQTVSFLNGATPVTNTESGPTLASVIALAKPKFLACDPTDNLRFYVAVTSGIDGYTALVSWAELDPSINGINQLLSLAENGASQSSVGPRNTVPGDVRGGRYVSGGAVITVFRAPTEVRIPSCKNAAKTK
jgi:hypothetical protein